SPTYCSVSYSRPTQPIGPSVWAQSLRGQAPYSLPSLRGTTRLESNWRPVLHGRPRLQLARNRARLISHASIGRHRRRTSRTPSQSAFASHLVVPSVARELVQ